MSAESDHVEIPGFEMLSVAGAGGMATVWHARQLSLDREVAIKVLFPSLVRDPESVRLFRQEARAAARLRHPGIVQVYDAGEHEGMVYLVMEFVSEGTVGDLLERKGCLPESDGLAIIEALAGALQYAWDAAHIIHCDIKPDNVMIDGNGEIRIADLGLARVVESMAQDNRTQNIMGTPNYTSPEQARGDETLDCRSDIYSAGAMLYHIVTGKIPFPDPDPGRILEFQNVGYLTDPLDIKPDLFPGTAWIIEKMMAKDPAHRYQSWNELIEDLRLVDKQRMPASAMPEEGQSTVLRGKRRREIPEAPKSMPPRKKIVIDAQTRAELQQRKKKNSGFMRMLAWLTFWAALGTGGYKGWEFYMAENPKPVPQAAAKEIEEALPPRAYRTQEDGAPIPAAAGPSFRRVTAEPENSSSWDSPVFRQGAEAFNSALEDYKKYQATRTSPEVLKDIESRCRLAIASFEAVRDEAPPERDMDFYIKQAYQLISDCRQSTLMPAPEQKDSRFQPAPELPPPSWAR
ncbi:MAG: serine/threonine-protein kinase [Kiritimatiellae bacterium]|nr:serine/threonine-protein kinase [Kiritimatiellia bacterium]